MKNASRYKKEVLQGFKTAGNLLLGFFTLICLLGGIAGLSGSDPGRFGILGDSVALVVALSILFATAHRWGRWIGGFFGIPGVLKSLIVLSSGHALNSPDKPVPRIEAASVLMFSALLVILTYPLIILASCNEGDRQSLSRGSYHYIRLRNRRAATVLRLDVDGSLPIIPAYLKVSL